MRKRFLASVFLALVILPACRSPADLMFNCTGEENPLPQVRGVGQLAANVLRPQPRTAAEAPVAHAGVNPFGINVFLNEEVEEWKRERSVQMIAEAGFHWLRQEFPWEDIEIHGKGDFEDRRHAPHRSAWEKYDHIVALAEQYGLELVPRLSNPPAWSRAAGDARGTYAPPDDLADWGDYVYAVVSRYEGRVRYYQLWNEPNIYPEWGEQAVDPEGYTRLLCEGYTRAKEADPAAIIISGALAPAVALTWRDLSDVVFLQRMYDAGASACFDVLAVNDYVLWSGPTDRRMRPLNINFARPVYMRDIMVANGDAAKPIWISEMSANAVPNDPAIQDLIRYGMWTPEQQARYAPLAYQRAMEEWPWVGVVNYWFFKRKDDSEWNQSWYYFRMVEPDFTPLPVYDAMRAYTAGLIPALYPGTHQEDHWALDYDGDWETVRDAAATLGAYRRAATSGATLRLAFEGASLTLAPGPGAGEIEVRVDTGAARRITLDGQAVRLVRGWRQERHEVALTAVAGTVAVDSLTVRPGSAWWSWALAAALATVGLILAPRLVRRKR
jgi:hypothetical protein